MSTQVRSPGWLCRFLCPTFYKCKVKVSARLGSDQEVLGRVRFQGHSGNRQVQFRKVLGARFLPCCSLLAVTGATLSSQRMLLTFLLLLPTLHPPTMAGHVLVTLQISLLSLLTLAGESSPLIGAHAISSPHP